MQWTLQGICTVAAGLICALTMGIVSSVDAADANLASNKLDVSDISILWPAPQTADDVKKLISADEKLADGTNAIWPEAVFKRVLDTAQAVTLAGSGSLTGQISFDGNKTAFESATNWKIAGIRIDPSAPGCGENTIQLFGSRPQIRLIVQPVTLQGSNAIVHDVTAHLVFEFVLQTLPPVAPGLPERAVPDRERFKIALEDLAALKADLLAAGVVTDGDLGVHPALKGNSTPFTDKMRSFLRKHLTADRLNAVSFMGVDTPEPWIFFAMAKTNGEFVRTSHPSLQPELAEMLTFRGGDGVMPHPANSTFGKGIGVSTAPLFQTGVNLGTAATQAVLPPGTPAIANRDIPDIIANPQISHFFNTDCVSCHSESTRRTILGLQGMTTSFQYKRPPGISGVSDAVLAKNKWNVRNFGWFPDFVNGGKAVESVSMRTANEAAASAMFGSSVSKCSTRRIWLGSRGLAYEGLARFAGLSEPLGSHQEPVASTGHRRSSIRSCDA